ncbi:MAG: hypothetical protein R3C05_00710 [Pirellulaceae bacterium]
MPPGAIGGLLPLIVEFVIDIVPTELLNPTLLTPPPASASLSEIVVDSILVFPAIAATPPPDWVALLKHHRLADLQRAQVLTITTA